MDKKGLTGLWYNLAIACIWIIALIAMAWLMLATMGCAPPPVTFTGINERPYQGGHIVIGQRCERFKCWPAAWVCLEVSGAAMCVEVDPFTVLDIDEEPDADDIPGHVFTGPALAPEP